MNRIPDLDPSDVPAPKPAPSEEPASWLDIPGMAGLVGGLAFLVATIGGYVVWSLIAHGSVQW